MRQHLLIRLTKYGQHHNKHLTTGGQCIALSTPNGVGNWFHRTWVDAEEGRGMFNPIKLHWTVHPERNDDWRKEQDTLLGPSSAAQRV